MSITPLVVPERTTTIPIIVGAGTVITPNVGYYNTRYVGGGVTITNVANNRISNTFGIRRRI